MKGTPIVFLDYMSRSGSTFLSAKLDAYKRLGVSIENHFPDEWVSGEKVDIENEPDLCQYLDRLYGHPGFEAWGFPREKLAGQLKANGFPIRFSDILRACLDQYFHEKEIEMYIFKSGDYYFCMDHIRTLFPDSKFVFIDRNPLAIFNSQKHTIVRRLGRPMCEDPVHFMLCYEEIQQILKRHRGESYLHIVCYERLMTHEAEEMTALLDFIGLVDRSKNQENTYYQSIPEKQKYMHENVRLGYFRADRADAWRRKLGKDHVAYLRLVLHKYLREKGYRIDSLGIMSPKEIFGFLVQVARHSYVRLRGFKPQR